MSGDSTSAEKRILEEDAKTLHHMGYAQELARRMGGFSNFAISFSIICILAGGITAFPVAFSAGGAFSVVIGWLIGGLFALVVGLAMAQIASAYPTAGGLYHWASILGGRGFGWACAWINMLGLIFVVASVNVGVYLLFKDLVLTGVFGMDTSAWGYQEQVIAVLPDHPDPGAVQPFRHQDHDGDHRFLRLPDPGRGRAADADVPRLGRHASTCRG